VVLPPDMQRRHAWSALGCQGLQNALRAALKEKGYTLITTKKSGIFAYPLPRHEQVPEATEQPGRRDDAPAVKTPVQVLADQIAQALVSAMQGAITDMGNQIAKSLDGLAGRIRSYQVMSNGTLPVRMDVDAGERSDTGRAWAWPTILVVGLLDSQVTHVTDRCKEKECDLLFMGADQKPFIPASVTHVVAERHIGHRWWEKAKTQIPTAKMHFMLKGVSSIVAKIDEIVAREKGKLIAA